MSRRQEANGHRATCEHLTESRASCSLPACSPGYSVPDHRSFSGWVFPVCLSQTPHSLQRRKETHCTTKGHSSVVLFERQGNAAAAWESSEGRWQRESEQEVLGNKKQERLLTKKTLAKKEKVFLAKKNVLILCSWMRYLKKHCRTFVFNSLILNPEGILSPEWPRTQCSGCHLAQCEPHI